MKIIVVLATLLGAALAIPADTYNPQYDNFNAQEVVDNIRLLTNYMNCFLGEGPCTAEGKDFKKNIPDALRTNCAKCTPKQQELIRTMVHAFKDKLPEQWDQLKKKEDPKGEFEESFNKFLSASN